MKVPTSSSDGIPDMLFGKFVELVLFSWITDVKPNIWNLQLLYSSVSRNLFELHFLKSFFKSFFYALLSILYGFSLISINQYQKGSTQDLFYSNWNLKLQY